MPYTLSPHVERFVRHRHHQGVYNDVSIRVVGPRLRTLAGSFGRRGLGQLARPAIERWLESLHGMATNSRAAYLSSARQFTAWLVLEGVIASDPCVGIPKIRRARSVPRAQSADAIGRVLAACADDRDRAIIWLEVGLGLRRAEVASLRWEDYDEQASIVLIHGKGGHERELPVTAEVGAALARIRRNATGPIIRSANRPWSGVQPDTIGRRVTELMRAAGVKHAPYDGVSGHALRHTAASDVLEACGDLRVVQEMLGHENLSTTAIYLRRAGVGRLREAMGGRTYA